VASAAVIGLPDSERGERVCAVVELVSSDEFFTFDEMVAFFHREGVMKQKIPEQLEIMEELPRSQALNKVVKTSLVPMFS
jgi:non-ribosomal peptide synthetase component E (peptide arylation enzyme)